KDRAAGCGGIRRSPPPWAAWITSPGCLQRTHCGCWMPRLPQHAAAPTVHLSRRSPSPTYAWHMLQSTVPRSARRATIRRSLVAGFEDRHVTSSTPSAAGMPTPTSYSAAFPPPDAAVATWGLTKAFGQKVAVNGLNLVIRRGEFFGFLGPNGA